MSTCPADGLAYREHPEAEPPSDHYNHARHAILEALARVIYWPGITDTPRLAILRARVERAEREAVGS